MHRHNHHDHTDDSDEDLGPSKTQRKQAMEVLQDLGGELVKLSRTQLDRFELPDPLYDAVRLAQRITSHGAIRRQMQLIGKLMRTVDAEAISEQLAVIQGVSDVAKAEFHAVERWRDRLIADDAALTEWLAAHPEADPTQVRQLIRNARREASEGKPPKSSRLLFKLLRDA